MIMQWEHYLGTELSIPAHICVIITTKIEMQSLLYRLQLQLVMLSSYVMLISYQYMYKYETCLLN